jgi:hypothetical protein
MGEEDNQDKRGHKRRFEGEWGIGSGEWSAEGTSVVRMAVQDDEDDDSDFDFDFDFDLRRRWG